MLWRLDGPVVTARVMVAVFYGFIGVLIGRNVFRPRHSAFENI